MDVLVMADNTKEKIHALRAYVEANPIGRAEYDQMVKSQVPPVGDRPQHWVSIPIDYRLAFSIEETKDGTFRHASISRRKPGVDPNPYACEEILKLLGYRGTVLGSHPTIMVWREETGVLNFAEPINITAKE